jgi:1-acyl-sn-glycerol-3-phosphate acyltransferase
MNLSETPEGVPEDTPAETPADDTSRRRSGLRTPHVTRPPDVTDEPPAGEPIREEPPDVEVPSVVASADEAPAGQRSTPQIVTGAAAAAEGIAESVEVAIGGIAAATAAGAGDVVASAESAANNVLATAEAAARGVSDATAAAAGRIASDARADTAAEVQELEVEIRNQGGQPETRDAAAAALRLIRENLERLNVPQAEQVAKLIRENVLNSDYLDPDFWRGIGMVLQYQIDELSGLVRRRARGEYTLDAYGMDQELVEIVRPFAAFMYRTYFRVSATGLEHVPAESSALLLANQAGVVPWDGVMIATALLEEHPAARLARTLHSGWMAGVPGLAPALASFGQVPALPENAERLLAEGQLVTAFPEGERGAGKLIWQRYRLSEAFAAEEYIRAALRTGAPIVPVAVVGSEEVYPMIANVSPLARLLRLPYFPLTPFFPWLGALGALPLPTKWAITFDAPIATAGFAPGSAEDGALVARLSTLVRSRVQSLLDEQVGARKSLFFGA